jgi:anthranilate phosphoribosyltransferase
MSAAFKDILALLAEGKTLSEDEARAAFNAIMDGGVDPAQIAAFLTALHMRGETVIEISAAASAMRARVLRVSAPANAIDTCGTGGDASGTFNISTCAALVVAGCGVPVAKHGNRAQSSKSGSADVLQALGVNLELSPAAVGRCLNEAGIAFMFAQTHHPAMRHVAPVRVALGFRTIFNLLGPLSSPAGVKRQVVGVFAERWIEPMAEALRALGSERALVVHGSDGLDEITTTGPTHAAMLEGGRIRRLTITPEDADLSRAFPSALKGGTAADNARAIERVFDGQHGPFRDIVCLNAAAALMIAGRAPDLKEGAKAAAQAIDDRSAKIALARLVERSQALKDAIA